MTTLTPDHIADNVARVQQTIAEACGRVGRDPTGVTLIAVSKTHSVSLIEAAAAVGVQHFGENRVEEGMTKAPIVNAHYPDLTWHMIGQVQSRKARDVPGLFTVVHSVDRLKLAQKLSEANADRSRSLDLLLEINISGEESKAGFGAHHWETDAVVREALRAQVAAIIALPHVHMRGLMTMAPIVDDAEEARPVFAGLAQLRKWLIEETGVALPDLSMGMTDDYPIAVEEGATLVRVGRAIFGQRST